MNAQITKSVPAVVTVMVIALSTFTQAATYGGGGGTVGNPYQIWTPEQLNTIGLNPSDWTSHFKLMSDIDMSIYTGTQYNIIGNPGTKFRGSFDGNNHVISNLTYTTTAAVDYVGLFGWAWSAAIRNLGLENVSISSGGKSVGGLAGETYLNCSVASCYVTGSVNAVGIVGGMVGVNSGVITNCYAAVSVTGTDSNIGGLVGANYTPGTVAFSYAIGSVNGNNETGGLIGYNHQGSSSFCYATGSIAGTDHVGGLVGQSLNGSISSCYATGSVSGINAPGGLIGWHNNGLLTSCYATGFVSNGSSSGGLIGWLSSGTINSCYATGSVSGPSASHSLGGLVGYMTSGTITSCYATGSANGTWFYGGLVGYIESGTFTACFWDTQTSGLSDGAGSGSSSGILGKTTAQMKTLSTFSTEGWDFANMWGIGNIQTYPYLKAVTGINPADINYSGVVDTEDLAILAANWLFGI